MVMNITSLSRQTKQNYEVIDTHSISPFSIEDGATTRETLKPSTIFNPFGGSTAGGAANKENIINKPDS